MSSVRGSFVAGQHARIVYRAPLTVRDRLVYHARRLGTDMNDLVRQATIEFLDDLDEKETLAEERKRLREQRKKQDKKHPHGRPPGLGSDRIQEETPTSAFVSDKIRRRFRHYAEFLEKAGDAQDIELRTDQVTRDLRERTASKDEYEAARTALQEFLTARKDVQHTEPPDSIDFGDKVRLNNE